MDETASRKTSDSAKTEAPFSRIFGDSPLPMFVYDPESLQFLEVNDSTVRTYGYTREELMGMTIADIRPGGDVPILLAMIKSSDPASPRQGTWRHCRKDGSELDVEVTSHAMVYAGRPARFVIVQDVTERIRSEAANRNLIDQIGKERQRLDNLLGQVPAIVWEFWNNPDESRQRINYVSAYSEQLLGYPPSAWLGRPNFWVSVVHPDDRAQAQKDASESYSSGAGGISQFRCIARDGRVVWVESTTAVIFDEDGAKVGVRGVNIDITERKLVEQARRFLAEASETLSASLDYATTLDNLTRAAVPFLADCCTIHTVDAARAIQIRSFAHVDPDKERALTKLAQNAVTPSHIPHPIRPVLESGDTLVRSRMTEADAAAAEANDSLRDAWRIVNPQSAISVPLSARGAVFGAFSLMTSESKRIYTEADVALATELARRASVAVDNARLYQEIQRANAAKNEFLAMLGHELRNPLGAIASALELIRLRGEAQPSLQRTLEVVERQANHMARLVDDLLDVSRITQGKIDLRREVVDAAWLVQQAVQTVQPMVDSRHHAMEVQLPADPVYLEVDPVRIVQVLSNLLSNAVKYTESGGRITICVTTADADCTMTVSDNGVGISPQMLENVFDLFAQAKNSLDRDQGGLGIGLTVVRNLVQLHGGSVAARSDGIGKGAEFSITLPTHTGPSTVRLDSAHLRQEPGGAKRRILLVEDNVDAARTLAEILEAWGHEVQLAHDGLAALELARSAEADVVLMDIGLPGLDGYEVARALRENKLLPDATLVALTGYGQEDDQRRSRDAGFDHHLIKPVDFGALERLLDELRRKG